MTPNKTGDDHQHGEKKLIEVALPLEAQRLGLENNASDLNPVAVLINKAMIEIHPRFAGRPPVNPDAVAGAGDQTELIAQGNIKAGSQLVWTKDDDGTLRVKPLPSRGELTRRLVGIGRQWLKPGDDPIADLIRERVSEDEDHK